MPGELDGVGSKPGGIASSFLGVESTIVREKKAEKGGRNWVVGAAAIYLAFFDYIDAVLSTTMN